MSEKKSILLGVSGSIAAYKALDVANIFTKQGNSVHVVMTKNATQFVCALSFATLTQNKVCVDMFASYTPEIEHISLAKTCSLCLIAPATANIMAKIACGIADDMLCATVLAMQNVPIIFAPAMNTAMWENVATQNNIKILKDRGFHFIEPKEDRLACGTVGKGAMADVGCIVEFCKSFL